jgi:hypothetical protein
MIPFFLVLLAVSFVSLLIQQFIPPLEFLEGARVLLMPLILFYGALALPYGLMLALAFACGLMWDAMSAQILDVKVAGSMTTTVEIAMGWSIVLYATLGSIMSGFRPLFKRGRWEIHCLMSGVCTSLIVLSEFLMISVRRAALDNSPFIFTPEIGWRIGGAGIVALLLAPIAFWILSMVADLVGYDPRAVTKEEVP